MAGVWTRRGFLSASAAAGFTWRRPTCLEAAPVPFPAHYRKASPYESLRPLIKPGSDVFTVAADAAACSARWNRSLAMGSVRLADDFQGASPLPARYKEIDGNVSIAEFNPADRAFASGLKTWIARLGEIRSARFFPLAGNRLRFEIASTASGMLNYRTGFWILRQEWVWPTTCSRAQSFAPARGSSIRPMRRVRLVQFRQFHTAGGKSLERISGGRANQPVVAIVVFTRSALYQSERVALASQYSAGAWVEHDFRSCLCGIERHASL